jgi:heme-degrading monooxygenase HmoA
VTIVELREMDERTTYMQQLREDSGPVVLMNQFNVAPEDVDRFLEVWADDAAFMKTQPGFISTQLHRGIAGSTTFMNVAVWESARALGEAFASPAQSEPKPWRERPRPPSTARGRRGTRTASQAERRRGGRAAPNPRRAPAGGTRNSSIRCSRGTLARDDLADARCHVLQGV